MQTKDTKVAIQARLFLDDLLKRWYYGAKYTRAN